ncbi:MAG: DUF309 domain-containing protein [Thermoflexales bacterium]
MTAPSAPEPPGYTSTVIAQVDDPRVAQALGGAAAELGWRIVFADASMRERFQRTDARGSEFDIVGMLVELGPALLVIGLGEKAPTWDRLITAAKTNPATRRIPILGIGPEEAAPRARAAGCDAVMTADDFLADAGRSLTAHARIDDVAELARQAALALPHAARLAVSQFNAGAYFEQHETFEGVWRAEPGPVRQLYQGLLLVGVAFLQIQRRNEAGARKTFQRARQYLVGLPDICQSVDVARFRADAEAARRELERLGPERIEQFDPAFFCQIHQVD